MSCDEKDKTENPWWDGFVIRHAHVLANWIKTGSERYREHICAGCINNSIDIHYSSHGTWFAAKRTDDCLQRYTINVEYCPYCGIRLDDIDDGFVIMRDNVRKFGIGFCGISAYSFIEERDLSGRMFIWTRPELAKVFPTRKEAEEYFEVFKRDGLEELC